MEEPKHRLQRARLQAGFASPTEAVQRLPGKGLNRNTLISHENGHRPISRKSAALYAKVFGVSPGWLLYGEGPDMDAADLRRVPEGQEFEPDPAFDPDGIQAASNAEPYEPSLPGARPEIDVKPGAGLGTVGQTFGVNSKGIVTGHRVVAEWVIPPDYMRHELGARPSMIMVMQVIGDSMEPTLKHNDRVLVDISQNVFGPDAVYVIDDGDGEPRVKRLTKNIMSDPPSVSIKSDNPLAEQRVQVLLGAFRIVGRVVGRVTGM